MNDSVNRILLGLAVPVGAFVAGVIISWVFHAILGAFTIPEGMKTAFKVFTAFPYLLLISGVLLGWRYNNTGLMLTSFFLILIYLGFKTFGPPVFSRPVLEPAVCKAALFLLPLNILLASSLTKRRIFTTTGSLYLFLFTLQIFAVALLFDPGGFLFQGFYSVIRSYSFALSRWVFRFSEDVTIFLNDISFLPCILIYLWTLIFLFARYFYKRDIALAGFAGIFASSMAGMLFGRLDPYLTVFFTASGVTLVVAVREVSFTLSASDNLTGLSARKHMGTVMEGLKGEYSMAMVDIDHFKRFNDSYGSESGDAVLIMVGDKLSDVNENVQTFRYGGEEFLAIFPGMGVDEVVICLEIFRKKIEAFPFLIKNKVRTGTLKSEHIHQKKTAAITAQITVSVGIASAGDKMIRASDVLKAADKALYYAKRHGRNRVVPYGGKIKKK